MSKESRLRWPPVKYIVVGALGALLGLIWRTIFPRRRKNFFVDGRYLYDTSSRKVILRGVNKMSVFETIEDSEGAISFPEIRKTGANSVRIVWQITNNGTPTSPEVLDALITNAKNNKLIPMIELHDATCNWSRLKDLVEYWIQPRIVSIIQKHQKYLLVNIGNEVGDDTVTDNVFIAGYTYAVRKMRAAGIHTPLVIDAPDCGKKLETLNHTAAELLSVDPDHNLIFSVHPYWSILHQRANANYINTKLTEAVEAWGYPLIVGEFSRWGAYNAEESICTGGGETDYQSILKVCHECEIGWYAWEWGPGNGYVPATDTEPERYDGPCHEMDMTPDRMFASLKPGWAEEVAISSPYSIKNTSITHL